MKTIKQIIKEEIQKQELSTFITNYSSIYASLIDFSNSIKNKELSEQIFNLSEKFLNLCRKNEKEIKK